MMRRLLILLVFMPVVALAEDGSQLWLRYKELGTAKVQRPYQSPTLNIATNELERYFRGNNVTLIVDASQQDRLGKEGFAISNDSIVAATEKGVLYGAYALLREQETHPKGYKVTIKSMPSMNIRVLNHWDNLDGSIERGYAGKSIFWVNDTDFGSAVWRERIKNYARANASIGINGTVLNNVNASPKILTHVYINKVKTIAEILRPYGIKVYLSINYASPMVLAGLKTADPLDKKVNLWWVAKVKEIYKEIPDFGGFLVKASSEGQPGPNDFGRTHADGANMLADALKPYGGIVMWRSFVYGANHKGEDRVKQAVSEFRDLDGSFRDNVLLQSKNGPLDFQPREPYAPIFDNIHKTSQMAELQITQEYLGQSWHLVYLAPMWKEFFGFVACSSSPIRGIAGVANIGDDTNWCGHHFSQANWYAFGRLAWNPSGLSSEKIAQEWLLQTFCDNWYFVNNMTRVMESSREACINYMMPLGLHHIFKFDHHYGPEPDGFKAEYPIEWCPVYYHKADSMGVGFDRSSSTGTNAVEQYREPFRSQYDNLQTCPDEYLLWFHRVAWDYKMKDGRTLWQILVDKYYAGTDAVDGYITIWATLKPYVDAQRWQEVYDRLKIQEKNAREWRDVCLNYFHTFSKMPVTRSQQCGRCFKKFD